MYSKNTWKLDITPNRFRFTSLQEYVHQRAILYVRHYTDFFIALYQFLPEANFGLRVLSLPASRVCPRDNSLPVQARITKFGAQMQNTLVKVPIVFYGVIDHDLQGQI